MFVSQGASRSQRHLAKKVMHATGVLSVCVEELRLGPDVVLPPGALVGVGVDLLDKDADRVLSSGLAAPKASKEGIVAWAGKAGTTELPYTNLSVDLDCAVVFKVWMTCEEEEGAVVLGSAIVAAKSFVSTSTPPSTTMLRVLDGEGVSVGDMCARIGSQCSYTAISKEGGDGEMSRTASRRGRPLPMKGDVTGDATPASQSLS
ncbi:MAG: hypothetical protein P4L40_22560, partial [Terracidiphilus sp.]|nr:hypothetical protein [Terracidiphilus sp.]